MSLTEKESEVVRYLRRKRVGTMKSMRGKLAVSHMTVFRAIRKYGYYSSVNHNTSYYTLHDIPCFDENGIWTYRKVCFSKHGNLGETLVYLVETSSTGLTVNELEQQLKTKLGNMLSRLCREQQLGRCFMGREAVYLSADPKRCQQQERKRRKGRELQNLSSSDAEPARFPPGYDSVTVLEILMQVIKTPALESTELAKVLRLRGVKTTAVKVQRVLDFYDIKKKRHTRRHRSSPSADA
jgi:hypothetical protein